MAENPLLAVIGALGSGGIKVVDLTRVLGPDTVVIELPDMFKPSPGVSLDLISKYDDGGPAWYWNTITMGEHTGTHFDAPVHWITGKDYDNNTTDTIPVEQFVAPAVVVDVSADVAEDNDFLLTPERIQAWESEHGKIPAGSWFLMRTDWSKREGQEAFLNVREDGPHSPGFTPECVSFLADDRDVLGVGVETVGTDAGQAGGMDPAFPCHTLMHGAGKLGLASLTNLDRLPATGTLLIAAPLKIEHGSGSPLRVLALVTSD
jgi:isatin hydrolase